MFQNCILVLTQTANLKILILCIILTRMKLILTEKHSVKIDEAYAKALDIQHTYQYITVDTANLRDAPSMDGEILGTIGKGSGFYINYLEVDEEGNIWCFLEFYDQNYNTVYGWCAYSSFE